MIAGFSEKLYAAAVSWLYSSKRTAILLLTPCCCIVMPNSMWAMLIVRLECAMTMDWQSVSKSRRSGLKRSQRALSSHPLECFRHPIRLPVVWEGFSRPGQRGLRIFFTPIPQDPSDRIWTRVVFWQALRHPHGGAGI